jgi:pimeloyl-ACP methyl ester carboxylesterase
VARFTRRQRVLIFLFVLLASVVLTGTVLLHPVGAHLRAMSLLLRFSNAHAQGLETRFADHPFKEEDGYALTPHGPLRFRTYTPQDVQNPSGVVLLHGVHHLGIDDPRLWNLARALAGAGVLVMTPELQDLADYRVTARTIDVIGDSAMALSTRMRRKVGVLGLSFAGGLALLAADRKEFGDHIGFVVAIGAHDDMNRVARCFAINMIAKPDGVEMPFQAHEYGVLVLAYSQLEDFFSVSDIPIAHEALRQWLWEQPEAMKTAEAMSPEGKRELDMLLHHRDQMRDALLRETTLHKDEMDAVSPHGHLDQLHTPVFLLHGAGDTVIPASETLWLAKDVPAAELRAQLVSAALVHVDMGNKVTWQQQWQLMDFMAQVLDATEKLPASHS